MNEERQKRVCSWREDARFVIWTISQASGKDKNVKEVSSGEKTQEKTSVYSWQPLNKS